MNGIHEVPTCEDAQSVNPIIGIVPSKARTISLTQGKVALVDDEDYEWLSQWKWCAHKPNKTFYAERGVWMNKKMVGLKMHRVILGLSANDGKIVDHRNRNGLDNRKINLRLVNKTINAINRDLQRNNVSGFRGVAYDTEKQKWRAFIYISKVQHHGGYHFDKVTAALAYDQLATQHYGAEAILNFPKEQV